MSDLFVPPWREPEWRADVSDWIEARLAERGLRLVGELEQPHILPWSTVIKVPTQDGAAFFKAGAPNQAFEAGLVSRLAAWAPETVLPVWAADAERGWLLMPDGERTMRQAGLEGAAKQRAWTEMLQRYAQLQQDLTGKTEELIAARVPDRRVGGLPKFFELIERDQALLRVGQEEGLSEAQFAKLRGMRPQLEEWCAALEASGPPVSIEHGDLHSGNVFLGADGELRIFDWGDATLSHPFFSLMVPLRVLGNDLEKLDGRERHENDPELEWARRAYLEAWTDYAPMAELLEIWEVALRVGAFQRSLTWHAVLKLFPKGELAPYRDHWARWLGDFIGPGGG